MVVTKLENKKYLCKDGKVHHTCRFMSVCSSCCENIFSQNKSFAGHSGLCRGCTQKSKPYLATYNEAKKGAERSNREFTLTYEHFLNLIKDAKCHYCGESLIYNKWSRAKGDIHLSRAYQLDRKNNSLGYTSDNVVTCCWSCNQTKSNRFSYEEFLGLAEGLKQIMKQRKLEEGLV